MKDVGVEENFKPGECRNRMVVYYSIPQLPKMFERDQGNFGYLGDPADNLQCRGKWKEPSSLEKACEKTEQLGRRCRVRGLGPYFFFSNAL